MKKLLKKQEGFTLIELMIVVAIIGILAAVAIPAYMTYIQKSRLTSLVFPGMHAIETNMGLQYATGGTTALIEIANLGEEQVILFDDADTTYFTPTLMPAARPMPAGSNPWLEILILNTENKLTKLAGSTFHATPEYSSGKIEAWELGGDVADQLGLRN